MQGTGTSPASMRAVQDEDEAMSGSLAVGRSYCTSPIPHRVCDHRQRCYRRAATVWAQRRKEQRTPSTSPLSNLPLQCFLS